VQENPLQLHLTNATSEAFRIAVQQMHAVGFEALVLSFGSGFQFELQPGNPKDDAKIAKLAAEVLVVLREVQSSRHLGGGEWVQ
jgi:hypothetical protein